MACKASAVIVLYLFITLFSILLTYALSVGFGHINAFVPYLGYIGDLPPESTVFTQCYVVDAAVLMFIIQVQYVYVSSCLMRDQESRKRFTVNTVGVYVGYIAAAGLFVHACFQESHAYYVHHLAEFVYLFGSTLYFSCQTAISNTHSIEGRMRVVLNICMCVFFLAFLIGYIVAVKQFKKPWEERYFWGRSDGGWVPYLLSATSEWILISLFQCYLLTFSKDFERVMLTKTRIIVLPEGGINQPVT